MRLARYGGSGIEAQLEWRGDWGELQTQWVPVDAAHVPSLQLRRAMIARYVDRWGPLPTPERRVVAAVGERPAHSRHQPARGAAPSFPRFQKKQSKWEIWMASALPRCVVGDAEWRLIVEVEARLTKLRKRTEAARATAAQMREVASRARAVMDEHLARMARKRTRDERQLRERATQSLLRRVEARHLAAVSGQGEATR